VVGRVEDPVSTVQKPLAYRSIPYLLLSHLPNLSINRRTHLSNPIQSNVPQQVFPPATMRTTIFAFLGLTLSASISAVPAQSTPLTTCTKDTTYRECVARAKANPVGIPVGAAVKGRCYPALLEGSLSRVVSHPQMMFLTGIPSKFGA
jgi:hypothetical protein